MIKQMEIKINDGIKSLMKISGRESDNTLLENKLSFLLLVKIMNVSTDNYNVNWKMKERFIIKNFN